MFIYTEGPLSMVLLARQKRVVSNFKDYFTLVCDGYGGADIREMSFERIQMLERWKMQNRITNLS